MRHEIPEITAQELAARMKKGEKFTILDVREHWELNYAHLTDERIIALPTSQISRQRAEAFPANLRDPQAEIVVMCHHGVRSADVTGWMLTQGWKNVRSLRGGIAVYAEQVDPSVGRY
jgi:rhodanese-related sulfurtransferase